MGNPPIIVGIQRDLLLPTFHRIAAMRPAVMVRRPEALDEALLATVRPQWVILPDWSWIVPPRLLAQAAFVGFHSAALPDYRGGSPLQHQILDGLTSTKLTCFRMSEGMDSGPILAQTDLPLTGTISEIWKRIADLVPDLVARLLNGDFREREQGLGGFVRRRRKPEESEIADPSIPLAKLYDIMRMLDDPYPNAFLRLGGKRWAFSQPRYADGALVAEVRITSEGHDHG